MLTFYHCKTRVSSMEPTNIIIIILHIAYVHLESLSSSLSTYDRFIDVTVAVRNKVVCFISPYMDKDKII